MAGRCVVAAWPTRQVLAQIDQDERTRAFCVVPWGTAGNSAWTQAFSPQRLGATAPAESIGIHPVVEQALTQLTRMVNHANNLAGSLDRRDAVAVLRVLHRGGYQLPHRDVYAWALANGWPARGAERLRDLAERIDAGRTVQMKGQSPLRPDALQRWKSQAEQSGPHDTCCREAGRHA